MNRICHELCIFTTSGDHWVPFAPFSKQAYGPFALWDWSGQWCQYGECSLSHLPIDLFNFVLGSPSLNLCRGGGVVWAKTCCRSSCAAELGHRNERDTQIFLVWNLQVSSLPTIPTTLLLMFHAEASLECYARGWFTGANVDINSDTLFFAIHVVQQIVKRWGDRWSLPLEAFVWVVFLADSRGFGRQNLTGSSFGRVENDRNFLLRW